jgi:hypothetical protein
MNFRKKTKRQEQSEQFSLHLHLTRVRLARNDVLAKDDSRQRRQEGPVECARHCAAVMRRSLNRPSGNAGCAPRRATNGISPPHRAVTCDGTLEQTNAVRGSAFVGALPPQTAIVSVRIADCENRVQRHPRSIRTTRDQPRFTTFKVLTSRVSRTMHDKE